MHSGSWSLRAFRRCRLDGFLLALGWLDTDNTRSRRSIPADAKTAGGFEGGILDRINTGSESADISKAFITSSKPSIGSTFRGGPTDLLTYSRLSGRRLRRARGPTFQAEVVEWKAVTVNEVRMIRHDILAVCLATWGRPPSNNQEAPTLGGDQVNSNLHYSQLAR